MFLIQDYIGVFAPSIVFLLTLFFLYNKTIYLTFFIIGFILNNIFNILLKLSIKEPRPNKEQLLVEILTANGKRLNFDKYGMPSGHAQICGFALAYITLVLNNPYISGLYLFVSILSLLQRYKYKNHTILQLIVGFIIGLLIGYLFYHITNKYITGNIKAKRDDNAPK
jgi:membrane-associated phospholipid phosphatase